MSRQTIYPMDVTDRGARLPAEYTGTSDGARVANDSRVALLVRNQGANSRVLTIPLGVTVDSLTVGPRTITVPAGESRSLGPFPPSLYNQATDPTMLWVDFPAGVESDLVLTATHLPDRRNLPYLLAGNFLRVETGDLLTSESGDLLALEVANA